MNSNNVIALTITLFLMTTAIPSTPAMAAAAKLAGYPETIAELGNLYASGMAAWQHYNAYAKQAQKEKLDQIAMLFAAMAASQSVTTHHVQQLLADLTGTRPGCLVYFPKVGSTRDNLKTAIEMEMTETAETFPATLEKLAAEGYSPALRLVRTAVDVHNHHRKKLKKIYFYTEYFFGSLAARFQKNKPRYFICRESGTVITERLPADCPVRGGPTTNYIDLLDFKPPTWINTCGPPGRTEQVELPEAVSNG